MFYKSVFVEIVKYEGFTELLGCIEAYVKHFESRHKNTYHLVYKVIVIFTDNLFILQM